MAKEKQKKEKKKWERRVKTPPTYIEAHNKAVKGFKRYTTVFVFIAIFNVIGAIFFLVPISGGESYWGHFLCLSFQMFIFTQAPIMSWMLDNVIFASILFMVVAAGIAAVVCWLGVEARLGKKKYMYASYIIYIVDWVFLILLYSVRNEYSDTYMSYNELWLMLGMHVITAYFAIRGFFYYRRVFAIEYIRDHPEKGKISRKWIREQRRADKLKSKDINLAIESEEKDTKDLKKDESAKT